jgi:hypothetical protein
MRVLKMFHDSLHKLDAIINSPQEKIAWENFSNLKFEPVVPGRKWGGGRFHCRIPVMLAKARIQMSESGPGDDIGFNTIYRVFPTSGPGPEYPSHTW